MGRQPCCDKVGLKRGPWTIEEDHKLMSFIINNGIHCWRTVPKLAGLLRCGKSCRLRWINYLRPDLKRGDFTETEENQIIQLHSRLGNRWSKIAANFPGRTDNEIKNHWNTRIKKRLKLQGLDPLTHKPCEETETQESYQGTVLENKELGYDCKQIEPELTLDQTSTRDLFDNNNNNNYDLWGGFGLESMAAISTNNNVNNSSSSYSCSLMSVEESATASNSSMGDTNDDKKPCVQENYSLQQWIESVDSLLTWDVLNNLDQDLFFLGNTQ